MPVNQIDRHIFTEWLRTFLLAISATLGLLLIYDMYDNLGDLLDFNAGFKDIMYYYTILLPTLVPAILPIAFLVSLLYSLSTLHSNNEIIALRACGVSFWKITRTLWYTGIVFSLGLFYLNSKIVPWSVEETRLIWENLEYQHEIEETNSQEVGILQNIAFHNPVEQRIWFMNRFNKNTRRGYGVTVSTLDESMREVSRIQANECYFNSTTNSWTFYNGRDLEFDPLTEDLEVSAPFNLKEATRYNETPQLMLILGKRAKDLSLFELETILENFEMQSSAKVSGYQVRYHSIMAGTVICFIVVGLAIPFSVSGVRVNPMVGVSKSASLFFAYYVVSRVAIMLGEQGYLSPVFAAWTPNVLMAAFAMYLYLKLK